MYLLFCLHGRIATTSRKGVQADSSSILARLWDSATLQRT
jgi:hypothetical protein